MAEFFDIYDVNTRSTKNYFDPFSMFPENSLDKCLKERYRFDKDSIIYLTDLIRNDLEKTSERGTPISPEVKVMITLRYLASNSHQLSVSDGFNVAQSTVSKIVNEVVDLWCSRIDEFVTFPTDAATLRKMQRDFYHVNNARFPRVIGAIDGTHVKITPNAATEGAYVNRKGFHSINVQAVCDSQGMYSNVVARWCGSTHDSFILRQSNLWEAFEEKLIPSESILLGDSGYPCRPWLLTPFPNPINDAQKSFNVSHSRTRVIIEQSFGRLKRQWNILHEGIRMPVEKAPKVIAVCFMLRNIAIQRSIDLSFDEANDADDHDDMHETYAGNLNAGSAFRSNFANRYFT